LATQFAVDLVFKSQTQQLDDVANKIQKFERQLAAIKGQNPLDGVENGARAAGAELGKTSKKIGETSNAFGALRGVVAALGLGLIARDIAAVGTQSQQSKVQLQALAGAYGELEVAQSAVERIQSVLGVSAIDARNGYSQLYAALRGTGISAQQLEILFVGLTKAARLSGAGAQEAQGALLQLKQGLASGVLAGDELRSVLESMPALTQQLAKDLGVTVGQLKELGAAGKITSDVLFNSAKKLAVSAVPAMTTTESLGVAFTNLKEKIAEAFGPAIVSAMASFTAVIKVAGGVVAAWSKPLSDIVSALFNFAKAMAPIAIGIGVVVGAMRAWAVIQNTIRIGQAAILAMSGPGGWALIAAGVAAASAAAVALDQGMKKVDESMKQISVETAKSKDEFLKLVQTTPGLEAGLDKASVRAAAFKAAVKDIGAEFDTATSQLQGQISLLDQGLQLTQAKAAAEQAVNNVYLEQAQRQLDAATTTDQRRAAIEAIYQLTVRNAQIEYESAMASIKAAVQKQQLETNIVRLKLQELTATVNMAKAQGQLTEAHMQALQAQQTAVGIAQQNLSIAQQIAVEQQRVAEATLQASTNAAAFAANMKSAQAASAATSSGGGGGGVSPEMARASQFMQHKAGQAGADPGRQVAWWNSLNGAQQDAAMRREGFATGGYVTKPTEAVVGEGGEPEYIIPASKMDQAMGRYASGQRGASVVPTTAAVNVNYSGSVVSMGGNDYISKGDVPGLLSTAVNQTLKTLSRSPQARRFAGI
jgi:hypothetical protein